MEAVFFVDFIAAVCYNEVSDGLDFGEEHCGYDRNF